jgi:S1-C subfamily serine protease
MERTALAQDTPRDSSNPLVTDLVAISDRFELVAKKVSPAVVYVEARKSTPRAGGGTPRTIEESGSGVLVRLEGRRDHLVFTNNHVIADVTPKQIIVHLADGRVLHPARIWSDPETDVAVLSLERVEQLPAASLGDSDRMQVGNWVLAVGSPFGLNQTVTHGIVSAKGRGQISLGSAIRIKDFLQTDAAINPGSSGGPLFNLNGEVIGINTAIASPNGSNSGVAFSIPINLFRKVAQQLLEKGAVERGFLGVQLSSAFEPADALRLGLDRAEGALVETVYPNTPASKLGLRPGDVVLELDRVLIRNESHLINLISSLQAGKAVTLIIWRDRQKVTLQGTVGDWKQGQNSIRSPQP